jgi:alpha-L-fucosidase
MPNVPNYLKDYSELWAQDPRQANLEWFKNAKWGLFIHYGLYSQLGRGEWVQFHEKIPIAEYEKLAESFNPENFDADFITDLALEAEMKYVTLVTCHHDGFALWNSSTEQFNSWNNGRRDLVRELAEQCDKKGLGFFAYFTHLLNWRCPWMPTAEYGDIFRPHYEFDEPRYKFREKDDFKKFWQWAHGCMNELLDLEYPLAGMWLDIICLYYLRPDLIPVEDTYKLIREKRPETLIAYKQGATGTEDFASPEFKFNSQGAGLRMHGNDAAADRADYAWNKNRVKHNEICMTLQETGWGWVKDTKHLSGDVTWAKLAYAMKNNCNMLCNTGPLPDGSIPAEDVEVLRAVGRRIRENGWPSPEDAWTPEDAEKKDADIAAAAE